MAEDHAIEVRQLRVVRGENLVLPGIDLEVPRGQVCGLLGPSGSGKSTLIRAIAGVQRVAGGEVLVLGEPAGRPVNRARTGYVTQAPSVYGDLSARDNLRYFGAIARAGQEEQSRALEQVGLADEAGQRVDTMSGGQRSRVSLAAAMLGGPDVLLLDEPTVGLDPVLREELWGLFHELADGGTTLLVSTHVMDEADRCDRLLLMRSGRIVASDTPDGIRASAGERDIERAFIKLAEARAVDA